MHLSVPILSIPLLLISFALSTPTPDLTRRDVIPASTIVDDVLSIDKGVNQLRSHVATYTGGLLAQTPLVGDFTAIHLANRKGYADANLRTSDFSAADSTDIVESVVDTVGVDIPAAVKETVAKKALFRKAGTVPALVASLKVLLNDHDTFSAAVSRHLTADDERGREAAEKIHDAIQGGIDAFST